MTTGTTGPDGPRPGTKATRRRGAELHAALLNAAWDILVEKGYSGFTYDAIAARAQTSRAVLYRRWPQRHLLVEEALRKAWVPVPLPDTGSLREDAIDLLRSIAAARGTLMTVLIQDLADYYRESGNTLEDLREIIGAAHRERPFHALVERAVERGEIAAAPRNDRVLELPLDLLRQDMLMKGGATPDHALAEIIDEIWLPLLRR